jgi:hypothetical protein
VTARLYLTVYAEDDLPTEEAHIASKSLGTVTACSELEFTKHLHGTDEIRLKINRHHPQAALLLADRYVIVHSDAGPVGGAVLEQAPIDLSAAEGPGDEWIEWWGRGPISVLERGVMDMDSNLSGGHNPIDGFWDLSNQGIEGIASNGHPIPMMKRVLNEINVNPPNAIAVVDHSSWDYDEDSNAAEPPFWGEIVYGADIGDDALKLAAEMSLLGSVVWEMTHLFKFNAYLTYGSDLTGAFGASTVRFEKGVNIADSISRKVRGSVLRTHLVVGGAERSYVKVTDPDYVSGDVVRWGFLPMPETADTATLTASGLAHIEARKRQTDVWSFPQHDHGDTPASGIYEPGPPGSSGTHYWVGDTVTLHSGTGLYDANALDAPISAITWQLKTGEEANGDYWVIPQVGATFDWPPPGPHHIPPAPAHPGIPGGAPTVESVAAWGESGGGYPFGWHPPSGATGKYLIVGVALRPIDNVATRTVAGVTWQPDYQVAGTHQSLTRLGRKVGTTMSMEIWGLANPTDEIGSNGKLHMGTGVGSDRSAWCGAWLSGASAPTISAGSVGSGTASSDSAAASTGDLVLNWGSIADDSALTAALGLTELVEHQQSAATRNVSTALGSEIATGAETSGWTHASLEWVSMSAVFAGSSMTVNDGHPDLVGTPSYTCYANCDHRHDVHRTTEPTVNDDWATSGYKLGTIWAQLDDLDNPTEIIGTWMLVDITTGAAVWLPMGGGTHAHDAADVTYDNTASGLTAADVQDAIDELATGGASALPWFDVTAYGAVGDGTTDDTSSINDAIAALNSAGAGVLYFPAGNYLVSAGLTAITVPVTIRGDGHAGGGQAMSDHVSKITCSSGSATLFTIQQDAYAFESIAMEGSTTTPSAGAGIAITAGGDHGRFRDISVENFYTCIDVQEGAEWSMSGCHIVGPVLYGLKIRHIDLPDGGDWAISNSQFIARTRNSDAGIRIESGGGGKITNCKINARTTGGGFNHGIDLALSGSLQTSVLLIGNNSIENVRGDAIHGTQVGSGHYFSIVINGNQVGLWSNGSGKAVSFAAEDAGALSGMVIGNNVFHTNGTARSAMQLTNCDSITLVGNELIGNFTSLYTNSGSTNITEVGAVSTAGAVTITDAGGYYTGTDVEAALQEVGADIAALASASLSGHYELLMTGSSPPEPLEDGTGTDWLYVWVT